MRTLSLAFAGVRGHARRLGATALAIILSVAFVATTLLLLDAMDRGTSEAVAGDIVHRDLVAWPAAGSAGFPEVDELRGADGLTVVEVSAELMGSSDGVGALATTLPRGPQVDLAGGNLPDAPGEVAVPQDSGIAVGDTVPFERYLEDGELAPVEHLEVVGVVELGNNPRLAWSDVLVVSEDQLRAWDPDLALTMVTLDLVGADEAEARETIQGIAPGVEVLSGAEAAERLVTLATGGTDILGALLLGFGAVAAATSALVIANTFAIVLAQRTRELALLRCVGATRSQVRRTVLTEALMLGVAAATAGVVVALGLVWGAAALVGEVNLGTPVTLRPGWDPVALAVPWAVGVAITLGAAWWPTRRATRVAPMVALHPATAPQVSNRPGLWRIAIAALLLAAGGAGLVLAASSHNIVIGVAAGVVSFVGVLVAAVFFVPAGIRALGAALRGVPGRLAVGNAVSNPSRAAATSAALLIGVTLITMTSVGAASAERSAIAEIDASYPADLVVLPMAGPASDTPEPGEADTMAVRPLAPGAAQRVAAVGGVAESVQLTGAWLEVRAADGSWSTEQPVHGLDPAAARSVLRDPGLADRLAPGTIGLSELMLEVSEIEPGATVIVTGLDGSVQARVVEFPLHEPVMPAADLAAIDAGSTGTGGLLVRLVDDADVSRVSADVRDIVEPDGAFVTGGAADRAQLASVLDLLVLITTALLGVAVLIAVVGIANTLALSVLERARENALLRALGLTRGQLRSMLTVEGVLLAVVSAVLGIALGVTYAWFGIRTLMPEGTDTVLAFPLTQLGVILALAVVAGLLASVLPARRAARVAPAAGLAAV